jgi:DNA-directed RNA polymerase subunit beta'
VVSFGKIKRGNREVIVTAKDGQRRKYLIGLSKHILVQDGDFVRAGTRLIGWCDSPRDILNIKGPFAVQQYLVNGVQEVYRSQGIGINNKHMEVIVRQMMRRVQIEDPGDTRFLEGEAVERYEFFEENDWIFDKKFIMDQGDSQRLKAGQLVTYVRLREENSYLKRNDKHSSRVPRCGRCYFQPTATRYYEVVIGNLQLDFSCILPGNDQSTKYSCYWRQARFPKRSERKRYRW